MASEWKEVLLEDVAADVTVGHVGSMASEYVEQGIPFLRSQNVEPLRINDTDLKFITTEFHDRLKKSALSPGDVVIVRTGKPGACAVIPSTLPVANCSDLVIIRCSDELDSRFLAYYVNSVAVHHVNSHLVGAVQQHFNVGSARKMFMRLPDPPEQRAIVHVLGTLDDKIELNRQMSETLEAMARALFKSWFVDFDPVRAKTEGRDTGLPADLAALFPDRLVDSELGEIPEGWEVKTLADICEKSQYGYTASAEDEPVGPRFLRIADINKLDWIEWDAVPFCSIEPGKKSKYALSPGDIVIARMADPGHGALIEETIDAVFASYLIRFRPLKDVFERFLQYWLRSTPYWNLVHARKTGSTRSNLNAKVLGRFPLVAPHDAVLDKFSVLVDALREKVVAATQESRTLAALRDALLPKLISGEVRIPEALE